MPLVRVLPVECLPRLPDLLHHPVAVPLLQHALDPWICMIRSDDEVVATLEQLPVIAGPQLDHLEAAAAVALAVEPLRRLDPVQLGTRLDPFVDAPKDLLVPGSPRGEVHGRTVPTAKRCCRLRRSRFNMYRYRLIDEETGSNIGHRCSGPSFLRPRDRRLYLLSRLMDPKRARELLAAERRELERALDRRRHEDDGENAGFQDPANLAADVYLDELDEGLADDLRARLQALERAEQRLDAGTYGLSIESGVPIPDARLEALPTAERTVDEERALGKG